MKKGRHRRGRVDEAEGRFRTLVDEIEPSLSGAGDDLGELYAHFDLPATNCLRRSDVNDLLYARIASELTANAPPDLDLLRLRRQLVLRHLADGKPLEPYYRIVQTLQSAAKRYVVPLRQEDRWRKAIAAAKDSLVVEPGVFATSHLLVRRQNLREVAASKSIEVLREYGYQVDVVAGRATMTASERERVARDLDKRVRELGGIDVADRVFEAIRHLYDSVQERHHVVREAPTTPRERASAVPWAHLLNLAAKYPAYETERASAAGRLDELVRLARAGGTMFDVEPFSVFELLFHTGRGLPAFLTSIALYDGMFTLSQFRPRDVQRVLRVLFGSVPAALTAPLGFTFEDAFAVIDAIIGSCPAPGPVIVSEATLATMSHVPLERTRAVLQELSHGPTGANAEYLQASEQTSVDCWFRPLLRESPGEYLIMDKGWCAPAFYEALAAAARKVDKGTDTRVGLAFEDLVRAELAAHWVTTATGEYDTPDGHAECDVVVETDSVILLVEMKKKPLTRVARGGSDIAILLDLAKSMFDAQLQLSRHELALYKYGSVVLKQGATTTTIARAGRQVERIALGLLDFGSMSDRTVMMQILETVVGFDIATVHEKDAERLEEVRERGVELSKLLVELEGHREQQPRFFCSWFLSLGQLLMALDGVRGNEQFRDSLFASRHVAMGTLDFYWEHRYVKQLKSRTRRDAPK